MKEVAKVTFVIIGTMIGAGFASGQEIQLFFNKYGLFGILGLIISFILTGLIIYKVLKIINKKDIENYSDFVKLQSKNMNKVIEKIVEVFLLISFYVMIAGFCAYFKQIWKIPTTVSAIIVATFCYYIFHKNLKGIISINTFLMPLLVIFIFYLGIKNIPFTIKYIQSGNLNFNISKIPLLWLFSSILYASYNSIVLIPMLIELRTYMKSDSNIKKTSIICSAILAFLGIFIYFILLRGQGYTKNLELPMLQIVKEFGVNYALIYGGVIITAILTSAISAGYEFIKSITINKTQKEYNKIVILLCTTSIFTAHIGFSNLVNALYPFFGVLGLVQIICIFRN